MAEPSPILTTTSPKGWAPDQIAVAPEDVVPEALLLRHSWRGGEITGDQPLLRVPFVRDDRAVFTAEGSEIPESHPHVDEVDVATARLNQLITVSEEQWHQPGATARLTQSINRSIVRGANQAFLQQTRPPAGHAAPPVGITGAKGILRGGHIDTDLDAISDLVAQIETNEGRATGIIMSPQSWSHVETMKTSIDRSDYVLGAGVQAGERRLLGLPVDVSPSMAPGTALVVDRHAVVSAYGPIQAAESRERYFERGLVAVRIMWRIGWNLVRPERCGILTVGPVGS